MTDRRIDSPAGRPPIDPPSHRRALIEAIREQCTAEDRSIRAVVLEAGVSPDRVAQVLAGEVDVRLDEMAAISNILEMETSELIARAEGMGRPQ